MTITEFSHEFDISYNGIASNDAPPLDLYEKSVYLTKAQLELIKNYFNPKGNKYRDGFENSSKRRNDLNELIRTDKSTLQIASLDGIDENSKFFKIPSNTFLIIQEKAKVSSTTSSCVNNKYLKVVPKTHDEYNEQIENPFKKPNEKLIWRLDYYAQNSSNKNVELITPYTILEYRMRYITYPSPIILTDLISSFPGESLSIDGITVPQTCKLSENIHREILDRAVEMASLDFNRGNLQARVQLQTRNE